MDTLLLWQWSTSAQIVSALILAVFMLAFRRFNPSAVMSDWATAWCVNLGALAVTVAYWFGAQDHVPYQVLSTLYLTTKSLFVLLIANGVRRATGRSSVSTRWLLIGSFAGGLLVASSFQGIPPVGVFQHSLIALICAYAMALCIHHRHHGLRWLAVGLGLRALLAVTEVIAYGFQWLDPTSPLSREVGIFLAAHSSFDTAAEWLIALGGVLFVSHQAQRDLAASHAELHEAHTALQHSAFHDPLTGLANRRAMREALRQVQLSGGSLLFFDLDGFKSINDALGHDVGDACLRRFADGLREHFWDAQHLIRYAGDEFLVIDARHSGLELAQRLDALRQALIAGNGTVPAIAFSVGVRTLRAGDDVDAQLRQADAAMYNNKRERRAQRG